MGIGDKFGERADDLVERAGGAERAKDYVDKGSDAANRATEGRYEQHVDKAEAGAKSAVDKYGKKKNKRNHK